MDLSITSSLCRLCLCCDDSFASIFGDKTSHKYSIASLLGELLQFKVSINDGYPKFICSSCLKTITEFKTFKEDCVEAMVTYAMVNGLQENVTVHQRLEDEEISNTGLTESVINQMPNADDLDAFGNPLTEDEEISETEFTVSDMNLESNANDVDASGNHLTNVKENEDISTEENIHEEIPIDIVEHPIKFEPPDSENYEDSTTESSANRQSEQDPGRSLNHPTEVAAEVVTIQKGNVVILDTEDALIIADLKRVDFKSTASTSRETIKTFSPSAVDKSSADEKAIVTPTRTICDHESREVENSSKSNSEGQTAINSLTAEEIAIFMCNFCLKAFKEKDSLARHIIFHRVGRGSTCIRSNDSFNEATGQSGGKGKTGLIINCRFCGKNFRRKHDLLTHERSHTKEKPYKCNYCDKCFTTKPILVRHIRTHTKEKPYKCSYCEKCFTDSRNVTIHMRIHTKEKPYKCTYCEKCFITNDHLVKHVRTHTKEKPYKCTYCEKCFTNTSNLRVHIRIHTKERPYKCSHCGKLFNQSSSLATHRRYQH